MSLFTKYIIEKEFESAKFKLCINDNCGQKWYDIDRVGNSLELKFIKQYMIRIGDVVFDCGAHQGYTSLLFSNWSGTSGKVYSFEPYSLNFEILVENIKLNNSINIFPYNFALGDIDGNCDMLPKSNSNVINQGKGERVKIIKLDNFTDIIPNFIKIDVEGFEMKVLEGASNILLEGHTKFDIEIHPSEMKKYHSSVDDLLSMIGLSRYECFIQWNDNIEPIVYNGEEINERVHLFLLPLK
jgi:FkbM family methyltransferase